MARLDRWLVHTCTIERPSETLADPFGDPQEVVGVLQDNVPCRFINIAPTSRPGERQAPAYRGVTDADYNLYLTTDTVLNERDQVSNVRDEEDRQLAIGPLDVELVINRYGRGGKEEFKLLYLKRRGTP